MGSGQLLRQPQPCLPISIVWELFKNADASAPPLNQTAAWAGPGCGDDSKASPGRGVQSTERVEAAAGPSHAISLLPCSAPAPPPRDIHSFLQAPVPELHVCAPFGLDLTGLGPRGGKGGTCHGPRMLSNQDKYYLKESPSKYHKLMNTLV